MFRDLSFDVHPGELVHLAGTNGAGKSTLMAVIAGLLHPEAGEVRFFPRGDGARAAADRRVFAEYLPAEANGLHLKMDAVTNLRFWTRLRGMELNSGQLLAELGRWDLNHPLIREAFPVEKFSTGMKRRLALARLALSPAPLWLLDEPVYGLDAEAIQVFAALLASHLKKGGLALVISHDLKPLEGIVTRTVNLGTKRASTTA